ncbi:SAM-dependent methyltransferase [Streptomyces sp. MBT53]|uniref:SAM-dependent methyltransferase n=1 Tax=Streptomyces sp. MBT53 TaxID=1488384 RepID=UPI0027DA98D0|nr:SAM-dependent methyltransferase [Streptomyces sp. MBT53]
MDRVPAAAAETLDLSRPVGLMLVAILQYVPDRDAPTPSPAASWTRSPPAADTGAEEVAESMRGYSERAAEHAGATPRTHADVTRFVDGTQIRDPGVVQLPVRRPDPADTRRPVPSRCGAEWAPSSDSSAPLG